MLPAYPDEVAWRCEQCGTGWHLNAKLDGLDSHTVHYSAHLNPQVHGRPFWVAQGNVTLRRETYSGNDTGKAQEFWSVPRRFFVPAFTCSLETMLELGRDLLLKPHSLQDGPPSRFTAVTVGPHEAPALAEFIVLSLEAERKDKLKQVYVKVDLAAPELWVLP
jgi:hypothetical protein